jgi:hypothetical protein
MSFNDAIANYAPVGWQAATGAQVQSLKGQFGWVSDTPSIYGAGPTANAGFPRPAGNGGRNPKQSFGVQAGTAR